MKRWNLINPRIACLAACLLGSWMVNAATLFDQDSVLYSTDKGRGVNWQSKGGVPLSATAGNPAGSNGTAPANPVPTAGQFRGIVSFGAVTFQKGTNLDASKSFEENASNLDWPRTENADPKQARVLRAQIGAPYIRQQISFFLGSVISAPITNENDGELTEAQVGQYWRAEPFTEDDHETGGYYWSPHAERVYAVQPGRVDVTWLKAAPEANDPPAGQEGNYASIGGQFFRKFTKSYTVSGATVKTPKKIYWTEKTFQSIGKPVRVPAARVGAVNIVYSEPSFPERVAQEVEVLGQSEIVVDDNDRLQELRTLWYDRTDGQIHAYNKEGRVFMELLGDVRSGEVRNQLGFEIVDVIRQATPTDVTTELGDELLPPSQLLSDGGNVYPEPVLSELGKEYAYRHGVQGSDELTLYAIRETVNLNDYQVYWMEDGVAGLRWPASLARYAFVWPTAAEKYSHYLRPDANREQSKATAVQLPTAHVPIIEWQDLDHAGKPRAFLTEDFRFYTYLDKDFPAHRSLIRFTSGDNVAFERVFSWWDTGQSAEGDGGAVPGFAVILRKSSVDIRSLAAARNLINTPSLQRGSHRETSRVINYLDGGNAGRFGNDNPFPGASGVNVGEDRFVVEIEGIVRIPGPGVYTFGVNSDDGFSLSIEGTTVAFFDDLRGATDTLGTYNFPSAGDYRVQMIYFENGSAASVEFWAAQGSHTTFNGHFRLVGDTANGGLAVRMNNGPNDGPDAVFAKSVAAKLDIWSAVGGSLAIGDSNLLNAPRHVSGSIQVGQRLNAPSREMASFSEDDLYLAGWIRQSEGTAFNVNAYLDPFSVGFEEAARGAIIPINARPNHNRLQVWWFRKGKLDAAAGFESIYWPSVIGDYTISWPMGTRQIVLASNDGSGPLSSLEAEGGIYYQNDRSKPGYNPNEEHALMQGGQAYALRDDLNVTSGDHYSSHPYVLLDYTDADGRPGMSVFHVLRETDTIRFDYQVAAGTVLQPPMPLPLMEKPFGPRVIGAPAPNLNFEAGGTDFTFKDRKGDVWVYRGPHHAGETPEMKMQFYYKTLPGFFFPSLSLAQQPPEGTITPYLRGFDLQNAYKGDAVLGNADNDGAGDGNPLEILYRPYWPEGTPVLQMAETLTMPKRGLPAVRGQLSLELLYQQSQNQPGKGVADRSVVLHDPTREKQFHLAPKESTTKLGAIPDSVSTSTFRGRTYFPNLPPHLSERFFMDPNRGEHGALVFLGEFIDEPLGDDYLLLNVIGQKDRADLKGLCINSDSKKALWDAAIDGLQTAMEKFVENPSRPGTFMPSSSPETIGAGALAEVKDDDVAVDSYALTAVGPGTGYVTLLAGNGFNTDVQPAEEPVAVQIIRVVDKLYRGELKIVQSSNPLAEKLTLQQVVDLAGKVEDFEFEWRISAPVDGQPPAVFQSTRQLLLGDGAWNHIPFPLASDSPGGVSENSVPAHRRAADVNGNVSAISRVPFQSVATVDGKLHFQNASASPVPGNKLVVRYENGVERNVTVLPQAPGLALGTLVAGFDAGQDTPPANDGIIDLYERALPELPQSIAFRGFDIDGSKNYSQFYLSLDLDPALGAKVYIDGSLAVSANLEEGNSVPTSVPDAFNALSMVYRLGPDAFAGGAPSGPNTTHRIAVELFSQALPNTPQTFNLRLEAYEVVDQAVRPGTVWLPLDPDKYVDQVRAIIGEGADVRALSDNYLIARYRATKTTHASYRPDLNGVKQGWSLWTEPQLAEGWIKRVLAGINPFNQRVTDLFNNRINSDVSILTQAGQRWEGDVALNLDAINDYGLIEIYETVLRRGKSLSIESGINYGPANDALLLAAGYLNDLYMMLGNEAWADAANPTIGIGTKDRTYGDIATALFAFKGQVSSLLEEELTLLRGRDDFLVPGVETRPVYNRLFWNYTRGIDSGEVIYALNYNIQENNDTGVDGVINADDARKMFPQGHGDAYGHYLTAIKGYYALLLDGDFDWVPRSEAVTVLGKPVSVDYQDERKFAAAAAALLRAGRQVFDLTWRKDYVPGDDAGWSHFSESRTNERRLNPVPRKWGVDHWASRVGQGAYLNWAMGNAILPDVDTDPTHEGIQKVDRTTVPELTELATMADDLQTALDNAEGHLTPLGIAQGSLAFDVSPSLVTGPDHETHFEQIYERAKMALGNALAAFDDAKDVTRLLRSEQDSLAELQTSIDQQEFAYTGALIELYGTPYTDDIGPGKTYTQSYEGPDFLHYAYVDLPERSFLTDENRESGLWSYTESNTFELEINDLPRTFDRNVLDSTDDFQSNVQKLEFNINTHGFLQKPSSWKGRRAYPGKLQQAASEIIMVHTRLRQVINDAVGARNDWKVSLNHLNAKNKTLDEIEDYQRDLLIAEEVLEKSMVASELVGYVNEATQEGLSDATEIAIKSLPRNLIAGLAAGGDLAAPARAALGLPALATDKVFEGIEIARQAVIQALELATSSAQRWVEFSDIASRERLLEKRDDFLELANQLGDSQAHLWTINQTLRELDDAWRAYRALEAEGDRIQAEREVFRQRSAALVQGFRTRDAAFRVFRNEKLERYKTLFDLSARYAFLAANAFDYETGLLNTQQGKEFINRIVNARALGVMRDGEPQFAGSNTGDPGLSSVLAEMKADFDVLKGRLGLNNPDGYGTTVSLRMERERIIPAADGDAAWQDVLERGRRTNLLDDADVRRYCMQLDRGNGLPVPGLVLEFSTTIEDAVNLFGKQLAGGDHYFDTSSFATKIFSVGVALEGYVGMDNPVANTSAIGAVGGYSPPDPSTTFLGSKSLAATPGIYLIPVGVDSMRSPPLGDSSRTRSWKVNDVAIPLPFNIGGSDFSTKALWQSSESLTEPLFELRKHQAFRPVSTTAAFHSDIYGGFGNLRLSQFTNNRLIGRSVWNTKWKLVIPGHKLLGDPLEGLDRFIDTVKDVKIHFVTYSYAGN